MNAHGNINGYYLNKLIVEGNYKYLSFTSYNSFEPIIIEADNFDKIQKISKDSKGNVLGYFSYDCNRSQNRIDSTYFVKFRYKFKEYDNSGKYLNSEEVVGKDFKEFEDEIFNHPLFTRVSLMAIADNPANGTYQKWCENYNGERHLLKNYTILPDGKYYDVYRYYFDRTEKKGGEISAIL